MTAITPEFIIGTLFGVYMIGFSVGFVQLFIKQLLEKI